jgi:large subunit ribosomal protein L21
LCTNKDLDPQYWVYWGSVKQATAGNGACQAEPFGQDDLSMTDQATVTTGSDSTYAVIATGGKQYRVKVGDRIAVERLHEDAGNDVTINQVLLIGGGGETKIGTPLVDGATVTARIDAHERGEKIIVFKFKKRKRYRRRTGHRQELTRLTITGITA